MLLAAEEVVGHAEGSVDDAEKISRAAAFHPEQDCDPEEDEECAIQETTNAFQPSNVDVGSGAGRLILAAATMRQLALRDRRRGLGDARGRRLGRHREARG